MSAKAYEEGHAAFYAGERPGANPHRPGSNDYLCWISGHTAAIAENVQRNQDDDRYYNEGHSAWFADGEQAINPHTMPSSEALRWQRGWIAAKMEAEQMLAIPAGKACFSYELTSSSGYNASGSHPAITTDQYTRILKILEEKS